MQYKFIINERYKYVRGDMINIYHLESGCHWKKEMFQMRSADKKNEHKDLHIFIKNTPLYLLYNIPPGIFMLAVA